MGVSSDAERACQYRLSCCMRHILVLGMYKQAAFCVFQMKTNGNACTNERSSKSYAVEQMSVCCMLMTLYGVEKRVHLQKLGRLGTVP